MKILFLDFDGVLNNVAFDLHKKNFPSLYSTAKDRAKNAASRHINPYCVEALKFILSEDKEVRIVVSSSWRKHFDLGQLKWILKKHGVPQEKIIGMTDILTGDKMEGRTSWGNPNIFQRGDLCLKWAQDNNVPRDMIVCVDDDNDFDNIRDRFVRTSYLDGLTIIKALEILKMFGTKTELDGYLQEEPRTEP